MVNFLAYGAIGLGLALAILAYRLLAKEQQRDAPVRRPILTAIYVFMGFALVLAAGGFASEYLKSDAPSTSALRKELAELQEKHRKVESGLNNSRTLMLSLMDLKDGKVERLRQLDPKSPEFVPLVLEIQSDLTQLDRSLRAALGD
jgi:hypothetical protein